MATKPRSYNKRSSYWGQPRKPTVPTGPGAYIGGPASLGLSSSAGLGSASAQVSPLVHQAAPMDAFASFEGEHFTATAACGGGGGSGTSYQDNAAPALLETALYPNIGATPLPFTTVEGNYGVSASIGLAYQAYFAYQPLRNTIERMVDFATGRIHFKSTNQRVVDFFNVWADAIGLNELQEQSYREYTRGGNVWYYKFNGKMDESGFNMLKEAYSKEGLSIAKKTPTIPIRYIILNPMQVYLQRGASYTYGYVRMLSTYEIERLKNPQTEQDLEMFNDFPEDIQRQIKQGGAWRWIFVPLDQNRLYYMFYAKQDYEPLAVPMFFPLLRDIEFKLNLKRIDTALANMTEQIFMLVTAGRAADQWNQVGNNKQLGVLQQIFQNQTVGRVLISDYTTKAEWKIPDIAHIIGPEKYKRVEQDIQDGLQDIFFGDSKFANASIKVKLFIKIVERMRQKFIEAFLLPEVKKLCQIMGFRNVPSVEYEKIQIQDEALMSRMYVQLAQLGLLDPEETFTAMKTGMLPSKEESQQHQADYTKERNKGWYTPLAPPMGGGKGAGGAMGRPGGTGGTAAPRAVTTPIGQSKASADAAATRHFGVKAVAENLIKMGDLKASVEGALMKRWRLKSLNDDQSRVACSIAKSIAFNEAEDTWSRSVARYIKEPKNLPESIMAELTDIQTEHNVDDWVAAVLSKSVVRA